MIDELTLLIHRMEFLRVEEKMLLRNLVGDVATLCQLSLADLSQMVCRVIRSSLWQVESLRRQAETDYNWLVHGGHAMDISGSDYPPMLSAIADPPFVVFWQGCFPHPERPLLGVVGTRQPSERARKEAWHVGRECAHKGIGLVSGLAHGIDGAAHAGCTDHGGYTLGVLASGIDDVHPRVHRKLACDMVAAGGCLLSEYGPGSQVRKYHFPARNRIISGLCRAVLVVEAPARSGALITAQYSLDEGRDVYVHAAGISGSEGQGTRTLAESGARVIAHVSELEEHDSGSVDRI